MCVVQRLEPVHRVVYQDLGHVVHTLAGIQFVNFDRVNDRVIVVSIKNMTQMKLIKSFP